MNYFVIGRQENGRLVVLFTSNLVASVLQPGGFELYTNLSAEEVGQLLGGN